MLVITDGNDNASSISLEKLVNRAQQEEVLLYSIGLLNEEERREARIAKRALDELTRESGGMAFTPRLRLKWTRSRCKWRTRSATSTPSAIRPRCRPWMAASVKSKSQ